MLEVGPQKPQGRGQFGIVIRRAWSQGRSSSSVSASNRLAIARRLKEPWTLYIDFGDLLLDENRNEEAVSYLLRAVEIAPRESRAHELLGKAYTRMDQLSKAQTELEEALQLSPQSANLHCTLAPVYRKQGIIDKAKLEYERCSALAGSHSVPQTPRP